MRRRTAAVMATILAATLGATPVLADELSVFNSKSEIEEQMEDMASDYSDENDVDMEVYYSQTFCPWSMQRISTASGRITHLTCPISRG